MGMCISFARLPCHIFLYINVLSRMKICGSTSGHCLVSNGCQNSCSASPSVVSSKNPASTRSKPLSTSSKPTSTGEKNNLDFRQDQFHRIQIGLIFETHLHYACTKNGWPMRIKIRRSNLRSKRAIWWMLLPIWARLFIYYLLSMLLPAHSLGDLS